MQPLLFILSLFFLVPFSMAQKKSIQSLSDGKPAHINPVLPASSYVPVVAHRLSNAKVLWINFDWLRENQIEFPAAGLIPEFEEKVLDAFAYALPGGDHDESLFTDQTKTFFADRYGGIGISSNFGSGRAASAGQIQIKGIGITPLVGQRTGLDHAHGGASLEEAIREAIWGEVNHAALPYGSNRVIAIIDSGASTRWQDGQKEKRALIIREDPLRPAHFMIAQNTDAEKIRIQAMKTSALRAAQGFPEYLKKIAIQYATAYAKRIYHGATSPSNIDFRGKFLDFGTETLLPSYQSIVILDDNDPFGATGEIKKVLLGDFLQELKSAHGPLFGQLKSKKDYLQDFIKIYQKTLYQEMVKLTGLPPSIFKEIKDSPEVSALGNQLYLYSRQEFGSESIKMDLQLPAEVRESKLGVLLEELPLRAPELSQNQISFEGAYQRLLVLAEARANQRGISKEALRKYMSLAAKKRNQRIQSLERPTLRAQGIQWVEAYQKTGNRSLIWDQVNAQIEQGYLLRDEVTDQLVLSEKIDHLTGIKTQKVFDLKLGEEKVLHLPPHPSRSCAEMMEGI